MADEPTTPPAAGAPPAPAPTTPAPPATPPAPATGTPATPPAPATGPPDWQAEAEKWKALARKHEDSWKAAKPKLDELEALRASQMTETEKAIADAKLSARTEAMAEVGKQLAEAKFRAAATGKVADVDAALELIDLGKFLADDGTVSAEAITGAVERLAKLAPPKPGFGKVDMGPRGDGSPAQLTEDDLKSMSPQQIVEAQDQGRLRALLGG